MTQNATMKFEAETNHLLEIMINSLYTDKEVFLRELISNASDALDKLRFAAITDKSLIADGFEGVIQLLPNPETHILRIVDNGIGMTRDEVVSNIGTIARSGTRDLLKDLDASSSKELSEELIGRFGVGFYSCLMVANRVVLTTRKAGEETATVWEYDGGTEYRISDGTRETAGTTIELHLKKADADDGLPDFTSEWVLRRIVKKHSDFVRYPIRLPVEKEEGEGDDRKKVVTDETLNSLKAIWKKNPTDVTDEERTEFYKHIAHDWNNPLLPIHLQAEGVNEFQALLFIPENPPFDLFSQSYQRGLQLYVRGVLIMNHCEELLPEYLRFMKGVVDATDLPLNISRETLQNNRQLTAIRKAVVKKVLSELVRLKDKEEETFLKFWNHFGAVIKEGVHAEPADRDRLIPILLFSSSHDKEKRTTLAQYVERMKEGQEHIYYLSGENREVIENSPHMEAFTERDFEVLFFTDPIDEFMVSGLSEYDGKALKSIGKGDVSLDEEKDKDALKEETERYKSLLEALQKALDDHVSEVRLSHRLTHSPACMVGSEGYLSPHIERLMRQSRLEMPAQKRILELNPKHDIIQQALQRHENGMGQEDVTEVAKLLHGQALLAESSPLPDPAGFARIVAKLMARTLCAEPSDASTP